MIYGVVFLKGFSMCFMALVTRLSGHICRSWIIGHCKQYTIKTKIAGCDKFLQRTYSIDQRGFGMRNLYPKQPSCTVNKYWFFWTVVWGSVHRSSLLPENLKSHSGVTSSFTCLCSTELLTNSCSERLSGFVVIWRGQSSARSVALFNLELSYIHLGRHCWHLLRLRSLHLYACVF